MAQRPRTSPRSGGVLIFDGDCGFCTWTARWARRRLPRTAAVRPWQRVPDLSIYGLTSADTAATAYWIDADGRAHAGALAVAETFRAIGGVWSVVGILIRLPVIRAVAEDAYGVVARNRHRLPGSTPACRLDRGP